MPNYCCDNKCDSSVYHLLQLPSEENRGSIDSKTKKYIVERVKANEKLTRNNLPPKQHQKEKSRQENK
jgi:hypothetical protein